MLFQKLDKMNIPKQISKIIRHARNETHCYDKWCTIEAIWNKKRCSSRRRPVFITFSHVIDGLLKELEQRGLGAVVCDLETGNPTLADDLTLIAMTPVHLQKMLLIVGRYVNKWLLRVS